MTTPIDGSVGPGGGEMMYAKSPYIEDTTSGFHAIQIFDEDKNNFITVPEAASSGNRYGAVWGNRTATAIPWQARNPGLSPLLYTPFDTDSQTSATVCRGGRPLTRTGFCTNATGRRSPM